MQIRNSTLDDLASIIGFTATVRMTMYFGDGNVYVPEKATENAPLAKLIGLPAMSRLVSEFGRTKLTVPSMNKMVLDGRNAGILESMRAELSDAVISEHAGISPRRVLQLRREFMAMGMLPKTVGKNRRQKGGAKTNPQNSGKEVG